MPGVIEFKATSTVQGVSLTATGTPWQTVVAAGGVDSTDNSGNPITNPYGIARLGIADTSELRIFRRPMSGGEFVAVRHVYDDQLGVTTAPVVQLFGRADSNSEWELLQNIAGAIEATIPSAGTNALSKDGQYLYTTVDYDDHVWDCGGCTEFVFVIRTAVAGTGGDVTQSFLQAKFL